MLKWVSAVQLLEDYLSASDQYGKHASHNSCRDLALRVEAIRSQLQPTHISATTLKQLLHAKVPLRVVSACCKILPSLAAGYGPRTDTGAYTLAARVGNIMQNFCVLLLFILAAEHARCQQAAAVQGRLAAAVGADDDGDAAAEHAVSSIAEMLGQQLQQAGLLELLPQLFQTYANQLHGITNAVPLHLSSSNSSTAPPHAATTTTSSRSSSSSSDGGGGSSSSRRARGGPAAPRLDKVSWNKGIADNTFPSLLQKISGLMSTFAMVSECWAPRGKFASELVPGCAAPVMQLSWLTFQHVSQLLDTHQMDEFVLQQLKDLWAHAEEAARLALTPDRDPSHTSAACGDFPEYRQALLCCPYTAPCLAVLLTTATYSRLLLQLPSLPMLGSSSSSSSSAAPAAALGNRQGRGKTQHAEPCAVQDLAGPAAAFLYAKQHSQDLPASHQVLLRLLGCSSKAVLFAATCDAACLKAGYIPCKIYPELLQQHDGVPSAVAVIRFSVVMAKYHDLARGQSQLWQHQESSIPRRQLQVLHCLLPVVLLYCTAYQPNNIGALAGKDASLAGRWHGDSTLSVQASQLGVTAACNLAGSVLEAESAAAGFIPADVHDVLLQDLLPLIASVGRKIFKKLGEGWKAGSASSSSGTTTSSSSSGAGGSSSGTTASSSGAGGSASAGTAAAGPATPANMWKPSPQQKMTLHLLALLRQLASNDFTARYAQDPSQQGILVPAAPSSSSNGSSGGGDDSPSLPAAERFAAWQQHAVAAGQLLEGAVRCVGALDVSLPQQLAALLGTAADGPLVLAAAAAGPGSPEQRQMISLLCSLIKVLPTYPYSPYAARLKAPDHVLKGKGPACLTVWTATLSLFRGVLGQQQQEPGTADPLAAVPWLAVLGRCFLLLAGCMQEAADHSRWQPGRRLAAHLTGSYWQTKEGGRPLAELISLASSAAGQLRDTFSAGSEHSITTQLSAAGFVLEPLQAQLQPTAEALRHLDTAYSCGGFATCTQLPGFVQVPAVQFETAAECMQVLGLALSTLAFPGACNNQHCSNLLGTLEVQLVSGRSCNCAGCHEARYCSKECQRQHWKQHKPVCKSVAAAKAAAATAVQF